jgi:hypothetical protein
MDRTFFSSSAIIGFRERTGWHLPGGHFLGLQGGDGLKTGKMENKLKQ